MPEIKKENYLALEFFGRKEATANPTKMDLCNDEVEEIVDSVMENSLIASLKSVQERRSSPRLKTIPDSQRPKYDLLSKRPFRKKSCCLSIARNYLTSLWGNSSECVADGDMIVLSTPLKTDFIKKQNDILVIDLDSEATIADHPKASTPSYGSERRSSQRLKSVEQPPYYGPERKRNSNGSISSMKYMNGKIEVEASGRSIPLIMHSKMRQLELHEIEITGCDISNNDIKLQVKRVENFIQIDDSEEFFLTNGDINECLPNSDNDANERRSSSRLKDVNKDKRPFYGVKRKLPSANQNGHSTVEERPASGYVVVSQSTHPIDLTEAFESNGYGHTKEKEESARTNDAPLAIAIVLSEHHNGWDDGSTEFLCSSFDGSRVHNKSKDTAHSTLRTKLALKNNMERNIPLSVICGRKCLGDQIFTYCGSYKVIEAGIKNGFDVINYCLNRLPGQPNFDIAKGLLERIYGPKYPIIWKSLVCKDISFGAEFMPIPVTNKISPAQIVPPGFKYITSVQYASNIKIPPVSQGCNCKQNCVNPNECACARLNGSDFPYVSKDGGRLIEPKDVIYECGPRCGCGPDCINRVSQRPMKHRLEVYRTKNKGWAVRTWDFIPSGAPLSEYTGIVRRNKDLDNVSENEFIFDIDCWHTMHGLGGREKRQGDNRPAKKLMIKDKKAAEIESEFCVDGGNCGNVSRFINHSCEPNLFVQCVLSAHRDLRLARIVLFAADDILPMEELAYDYGYSLDSVVGPDGKLKRMRCFCGAKECRGRMY